MPVLVVLLGLSLMQSLAVSGLDTDNKISYMTFHDSPQTSSTGRLNKVHSKLWDRIYG